jgi:hypothetical protein
MMPVYGAITLFWPRGENGVIEYFSLIAEIGAV